MRRDEEFLKNLTDMGDAFGSTIGSRIEAALWRIAARRAGSGGGSRGLVREFEERARQADERASPCRTCGRPVEPLRRVYAMPTCYACLPPPTLPPFNLPRSQRA